MTKLILLPFLLITELSVAQTDSSLIKFINPTTLSKPKGYSHVVSVNLGTCQMILISGQVSLDNQGNLIGKGSMKEQAEQVFSNIKNALAELGGTMNDLVKISYYVTDVSQIQTIRNVRDKLINIKNPPASTLVEVRKLFRDDLLLEIEATAIIPN